MSGTILLGIDVETACAGSATYARHGPELLAAEGVRATWYVTGQTLERDPDLFVAVDRGGVVDVQSHTYTHMLLKTVLIEAPPGRLVCGAKDWFLKRGASNEEIDQDLARCQKLFRDVLGRPAVGLCGPWNYYRGLGDRPDLLEIVHRHGFRILRTAGRNEKDYLPVPLEWQPYWYQVQGFPDVLELPIQGYQDEYQFVEANGLADARGYPAYLRPLAERVAREDLVWNVCSHDHGCHTLADFRAKTSWVVELIRFAKPLGIRFVTAADYYQECLAGQRQAVGAR